MIVLWFTLAMVLAVLAVAYTFAKTKHENGLVETINSVKRELGFSVDAERITQEEADKSFANSAQQIRSMNVFPIPSVTATALKCGAGLFVALGLFNGMFFYAEPGYVYHVRTITGTEKRVDDVGFNMHLFGRVNAWKKAMSIVAKASYAGVDEDKTTAENDNNTTSATLGPVRTIFLDQVDSHISATARFLLPTDEETFLKMAREYRSPDNLLRTTLLPAFQETLQANSALMGAEDYFSGGRTQFNIDFEDQLQSGLFLVQRKEVTVRSITSNNGSANAAKTTDQDSYGDDVKVVFVVEKLLDNTGVPIRKIQSFKKHGITVVESRITDVVPNPEFNDRMKLKQQASADRAIAREERIQEEEQRLLAEATGARQVAQKKADALVDQIDRTTKAETVKQLALTAASQQLEQAEIDRLRAAVLLETATIDAQAVEIEADARAHARKVLIEADNALAMKLATEEKVQKYWADAYAKRAVPQYDMRSGSDGNNESAGGSEVQSFMRMMTMSAAKNLSYERAIEDK